jgi:hypothetical protein
MADLVLNETTTERQTAYKKPRPRLLCWLKESNAHGLVYDPCFMPEGEKPDGFGEWIRAPWMDEPDVKAD